MHEVILIWSQTDIHQQLSNEQSYIGWAFYVYSSQQDYIISHSLISIQKEIENSSLGSLYARTVLWFSHHPS